MGSQSSKIEKVSAPQARGHKQNQDDLMSKATENTEDSSLPPSPAMTFYRREGSKENMLPGKDPSAKLIPPRSGKESLSSHNRMPSLDRYPSGWTLQGASLTDTRRTIPVKCPPRKTGDTRDLDAPQQSFEDVQFLTKMYDSRTWEMYRRITEARKNSSYESNSAPMTSARNGNTTEWENLRHDSLDSLQSGGHDMIFEFDFE